MKRVVSCARAVCRAVPSRTAAIQGTAFWGSANRAVQLSLFAVCGAVRALVFIIRLCFSFRLAWPPPNLRASFTDLLFVVVCLCVCTCVLFLAVNPSAAAKAYDDLMPLFLFALISLFSFIFLSFTHLKPQLLSVACFR